jgi:hypothetical protein
MAAMPSPDFGAPRAAAAPLRRPPAELGMLLRDARERGLPFSPTFSFAVHTATAGRVDAEAWREVFSQTRDVWRRAYTREPQTAAERAVATLVEDVVLGGDELPERACECCGQPLIGVHRLARYCDRDCRRTAATRRERMQAA